MKKILMIILICYACFANAQNEKVTTNKPEQFLTIKLDKFPIADFPENSMPVSGIQLIQLVNDSVNLGYALKGLTGTVVMLKPAKPLNDFLQEHIARMYKHEYKKNGAKMLWVLKDLHFGERLSTLRYIYTGFKADAYISKDGNLFKKVSSMDTVLIAEADGVVTRAYGLDIENAFKGLVKKIFKEGENMLNQSAEEKTVEQIVDQSKQNMTLPILTDTVYNEGAYASFREFIQNKPSILNFESVATEKSGIKFIKPGSNSQTETLAVWGICQKGEIYKYHEGSLIAIEKHGNGFIISNYKENTNRTNHNLFFSRMAAAQVGGIAGGLIAYNAYNQARAKQQLLVKSIPYINEPDKLPVATCIDMKTGEFSF
jgi:hypothetical protein